MYNNTISTLLLISIVGLVSGHTEIINVNNGTVGLREISTNSPIKDLSSPDMVCGIGSQPSSGPLSINAGDPLTLNYLNKGRAPEFLDPSHQGPCIVYIAEASDPSKFSTFFREGYDASGVSCNNKISETGILNFNLPSNLKSGKYIVRTELVALHEADGAPPVRGAQLYIQCIDVDVKGTANGVGIGSGAVTIPGHLTQASPGISFNVYNVGKITNYPIPGPQISSEFSFAGTPKIESPPTPPIESLPPATINNPLREVDTNGSVPSVTPGKKCGRRLKHRRR